MAGRLKLKRRVGEAVEIRHRSGDVILVEVLGSRIGSSELGFVDTPRNFEIHRPEAAAAALPASGGRLAVGGRS
jgi:sRNA-binding carbon storage regulator CsrA